MSKKLLPILMVVVFATMAMAGDMEYTVYGKLHMSTQMNNDSENSQLTLSSNTSRFGVKGSQELAENYTLIWQFEQAMDLSNSGGVLSNRNSFLGMKGTWGSWLIGIHDTPMKTLGRKATFFYDTVGDFRTTTMGWDKRYTNIIMYSTPKMEKFMGQAMYRYDQNAIGADEAANVMSVMAAYNDEDIFLGAAFETNTKGNYAVADPEAASAIRVAGKYSADQFGISALFQTVSNAAGIKDLSQQTIGGEVMFHASPEYDIKGGYYMADPNTDVDNDDYALATFGVDRNYGKDVTVYIQFAMIMNGDDAAMGLGGNGWGDSVPTFAAGESPYSVSLGLWKKF